jgi:oxygen-independent coproporphyrinogen-3 oxidase
LPNSESLISSYTDALLLEAKLHKGTKFDTLFIGGGTPSLLGADNLDRMISGLNSILDLTELNESTLEANPESFTEEFANKAFYLGFYRISLGIQSLDDMELKSVGRIHNKTQAIDAINLATKIFPSVSADLMIGLPGQTWESLSGSSRIILELGVTHISAYCLHIEEGTKLCDNPSQDLPTDDEQAELYYNLSDLQESYKLTQYEISNFAKKGQECLHNLNYWHAGNYIGLGPNASSHINGVRFKNNPDLNAYLQNPTDQRQIEEELNNVQRLNEEAMLRLRLTQGLDLFTLAEKHKKTDLSNLKLKLDSLYAKGRLVKVGTTYKIPKSKLLTSNPIFIKILDA